MASRVAVRTDERLGIREEASFARSGDSEIFCVTYHPAGTPKAGIVIACSLFAEQLKIYRTEVVAARAFAAQGYAVLRFHYRGTGHSGGLTDDATATTMIDDTTWAARYLGERTGSERIVLCGARWGGLIAGLAARSLPGAPLALWEPVVDGSTFFREAFRARRISALAAGGTGAPPSGVEELRRNGIVDMMGYPIYRGLYDTGAARSLLEVAQGPARPVLVVQVSPHQDMKPELARLIAAFRAAGSSVDVAAIQREEAWTFVGSPVQSTQEMIDTTLRWLPGATGQ